MIDCATRVLLAFVIVMAADHAHAAAPVPGPDSVNPETEQTHPKPAKHPVKPEAHRNGEQPGTPPGKTTAAAAQKPHPLAAPPTPPPEKPAPAKETSAKDTPAKDSGEPPPKLPRFAALKTDDTNMRKGPGQRYPIEWVYQRRDLPMEVTREYDVWRYVRDPDGIEGWVHQVTLSDRRTFVIKDKDATLRADAKDTASPVALLKIGVIGRLRECDEGSAWCLVQAGGYKGYLRRDQFWGLLPDEVLAPS